MLSYDYEGKHIIISITQTGISFLIKLRYQRNGAIFI